MLESESRMPELVVPLEFQHQKPLVPVSAEADRPALLKKLASSMLPPDASMVLRQHLEIPQATGSQLKAGNFSLIEGNNVLLTEAFAKEVEVGPLHLKVIFVSCGSRSGRSAFQIMDDSTRTSPSPSAMLCTYHVGLLGLAWLQPLALDMQLTFVFPPLALRGFCVLDLVGMTSPKIWLPPECLSLATIPYKMCFSDCWRSWR